MKPDLEPRSVAPEIRRDRGGLRLLWLTQALLFGALVLLSWRVPPLARYWQACREYPFQLDAEEGFILGQAATLARGESIYRPIDQPPFLVGNYTPFFPWIYSLANGSKTTLRSLPVGRMLVELAAIGAGLALALIALIRTRRPLITLLAPLLFLSSYEVYHWGAFVRVDFPALLLIAAGLGVFLTARPRWGTALAAVLFVAAFYTRQTAIVAPLACAVALAFHDRRRLVWFLAPYLGLGLIFFAWFQWRSGGEFFRHVVVYNQNQMDWTGWVLLMKNEIWFFNRWWIVAMVLLLALNFVLSRMSFWAMLPERRKDHQIELPYARHAIGLYAFLSALSLVSYAKVGAAPNYALEPLAAAALWTALTLSRLIDRLETIIQAPDEGSFHASSLKSAARRRIPMIVLWVCFALLTVHGGRLWDLYNHIAWSTTPTPYDRAAAYELLDVVQAAPGDVLSEEPIFTLLADKPVLLQPFITAQLAREGRWSDRPLVDWLRLQRFGCVVTCEDLSVGGEGTVYNRYTAATAAALRQNYVHYGRAILPTLPRFYDVWLPREK